MGHALNEAAKELQENGVRAGLRVMLAWCETHEKFHIEQAQPETRGQVLHKHDVWTLRKVIDGMHEQMKALQASRESEHGAAYHMEEQLKETSEQQAQALRAMREEMDSLRKENEGLRETHLGFTTQTSKMEYALQRAECQRDNFKTALDKMALHCAWLSEKIANMEKGATNVKEERKR